MYSKQEAAKLKQEFWTAFGVYMSPVPSSEGEKQNWINYRTGEKDVFFSMFADQKKALISIDIRHKDAGVQELFFEQFTQLKKFFVSTVGDDWQWQLHTTDDSGKTFSRIYKEVYGMSIFNKQDWPSLISFFKTNITALDAFWYDVKYGFESLH